MDAALFSGAIIIAIVARQASANRLERNNKKSVKTIEELKRYDLSIAHKACNFYQMDELVWNHISARHEDGWLITPGRMMWDVINPSDIVAASDNCTADIIHSAVYKVRPDVKAIIHLHTKYAAAVACIETGFIPLTQDGSFFFEKVRRSEERRLERCDSKSIVLSSYTTNNLPLVASLIAGRHPRVGGSI